jgi:hypothetical protein
MSEQAIQQRIRLACSRGDTRLWRNNTGRLRDERGQLVTFGLCPGSADLIGYRTVTITPGMVGTTLAVFAAVEVKTATGRPTSEQTAFLEHVTAAGGIAGIARSVEEAQALLGGHPACFRTATGSLRSRYGSSTDPPGTDPGAGRPLDPPGRGPLG